MSKLQHNPPTLPIICLMGPTASGKTELAMGLRERLSGEIISVDSALVYQGMDIGTAKPNQEELKHTPHRLINLIEPTKSYSAARFRSDAIAAIEDILSMGRRPLLVGGTMLYFRALLKGLSRLPEADPVVRKQLEAAASEVGWPVMHDRLKALDPVSAARLHPNDSQRICRALEIYQLTGQPMSAQIGEDADQVSPPFAWPVIKLAVMPRDRKELHRRIESRFLQMLEAGFEEEVRGLLNTWELSHDMPAMRCVGYRQMFAYLQGTCSRDEMIEKGIIATRQLAKRQITWLRSEKDLHWIYPEEVDDPLEEALRIIVENQI